MPNTKLTPGIVSALTSILNGRLLPEIYKEIKDAQGEHRAKIFKDDLGKGISALYSAVSVLNDGKGYSDTKPPYPDRHYAHQSGWQSLIQNELLKFNSKGSSYITSISECLIKTLGLINVHQNANKRTLAYYRGHVNSDWEIVSSIGRKIPKSTIPTDRSTVSQFEMDALEKWQSVVLTDDHLTKEIFSDSPPYEKDDPRWWGLKQHYDDDPETGGTRLIDWTSSPLCGLYFACVDWKGGIDDSIDGGLYVTMSGGGRMFASESYISQLQNYEEDFYDKAGSNVGEYFSLSKHLEYPRTVITETENTRQLAQDGHFMFSPYFENPITEWAGSKPFFFVIPGDCKKDISRELYSLGYTPKKILRGQKGIDAHNRLKAELNISD